MRVLKIGSKLNLDLLKRGVPKTSTARGKKLWSCRLGSSEVAPLLGFASRRACGSAEARDAHLLGP